MTRFAEPRTTGGAVRGAQVSVLDHDNCANSDWLRSTGSTSSRRTMPSAA